MARTILLVEDDEPILKLIATTLAKEGHRVFKAIDAGEAEKIWMEAGQSFDLLITDVRLATEEDGFTLAGKFVESHPEVPVIFVSGDRDCFACPAIQKFADSPFIAKPFDIKKMVAVVNKALAQRAPAA